MTMPRALHTYIKRRVSIHWVTSFDTLRGSQEYIPMLRYAATCFPEWERLTSRSLRTHDQAVKEQRVLLRLCLLVWRNYIHENAPKHDRERTS